MALFVSMVIPTEEGRRAGMYKWEELQKEKAEANKAEKQQEIHKQKHTQTIEGRTRRGRKKKRKKETSEARCVKQSIV